MNKLKNGQHKLNKIKHLGLFDDIKNAVRAYNQTAKMKDFRIYLDPTLDDWNWDYETILRENEVTVDCPDDWGFYWKHGCIHIGQTTEIIARKAAALFVSLWLRNVSASFCGKLMDGFICLLERQEGIIFLAELDRKSGLLRLTRDGVCTKASLTLETERKIIEAINAQPGEEIIVTFNKRKVNVNS